MTRAALVDFETTGLTLPSISDVEKQPRIIEVGIALFERGVLVDSLSQLIFPEQEISAEITKITGITNELLVGMPKFADVLASIDALLAGTDEFWAHNAPFDKACLDYEMWRLGNTVGYWSDRRWPATICCSAQEFTHEFGFRPKLTQLYEAKMGKPLAQTHRALDDVMAMSEVLVKEGLI